jgi:SAM-dependent methyltransferase
MTIDEAFWKLHEKLPRQTAGSDQTTERLFAIASTDSSLSTAIDMGCGSGRASLALQVTAIDTHPAFLTELLDAAQAQGLTDKISIENMSMDFVSYPDASFDLVWAEGTMYLIGWERALQEWRRLLKPGGKLVATDCFWLTDKPSPETKKFWEADPLMMSVEKARKIAENTGYKVKYIYEQPDEDWFAEYYNPLEERIQTAANSTDPGMQEAIAMARMEIEIRRKYGNEYGHVGFVLEKA